MYNLKNHAFQHHKMEHIASDYLKKRSSQLYPQLVVEIVVFVVIGLVVIVVVDDVVIVVIFVLVVGEWIIALVISGQNIVPADFINTHICFGEIYLFCSGGIYFFVLERSIFFVLEKSFFCSLQINLSEEKTWSLAESDHSHSPFLFCAKYPNWANKKRRRKIGFII